MLDLGILYSDGEQQWRSITDIGLFRLTEVLTLSFTSQRGLRSALKGRYWSWQNNEERPVKNVAWWGEDFYGVGVLPDETYVVRQWAKDDEFLIAHSIADGSSAGRIQAPVTFPENATVTIFEGGYLAPNDWRTALAVFESEMF